MKEEERGRERNIDVNVPWLEFEPETFGALKSQPTELYHRGEKIIILIRIDVCVNSVIISSFLFLHAAFEVNENEDDFVDCHESSL